MLRVDAFTDTQDAIRDRATFRTGWAVLALLLMGFFATEPLGVPVSLVAACGALVLLAVAKRGRAIDTGKVLRGRPADRDFLAGHVSGGLWAAQCRLD